VHSWVERRRGSGRRQHGNPITGAHAGGIDEFTRHRASQPVRAQYRDAAETGTTCSWRRCSQGPPSAILGRTTRCAEVPLGEAATASRLSWVASSSWSSRIVSLALSAPTGHRKHDKHLSAAVSAGRGVLGCRHRLCLLWQSATEADVVDSRFERMFSAPWSGTGRMARSSRDREPRVLSGTVLTNTSALWKRLHVKASTVLD
jgi:hypothetical protein